MLNNGVNWLSCRVGWIIFAVVGIAVSAHGQAANNSPERGFHAGGSYALSEIETISRSSGELSLNIPLASLPRGRGGLSASVRLLYSSKLWDSYEYIDDTDQNPVDASLLIPGDAGEGNWRYGFEYRLKLKNKKLPYLEGNCDSASGYVYQLVLVTPDGGQHTLRLDAQYEPLHVDSDGYMNILPDGQPVCTGAPVTGTITYYSTDGTYIRLDLQHDADQNWENNPWTLSLPDGTRVLGGTVPNSAVQRIIDRNGNYIDILVSTYGGHVATYIQDQLGRAIFIETYSTTQDKIHVNGAYGHELVWTVQWRNITVHKTYHLSDHDVNHTLSRVFRVVDKIFLPAQAGSLNYTFDYNANTANPSLGWGELSSITLPSGASTTYGYQRDNANGSTLQAFHILRNRPTQKTLTYNGVYDGVTISATEQWTFTAIYSGNGASPDDVVIQTTTTGPDGGISNEFPRRFPSGPYIPEETGKTVNPDGSVVERVYNYNPPNSLLTLGLPNRFVKYEFTSITNQAGALSKTAIKENSYDLNGNLLTVKEYDWVDYSVVPRDTYLQPTGLPTPAPTPVRVTVNDYWVQMPSFSDPDIYSKPGSPNLRNAIKSSEAQNGSATPFARSDYTYDSATTTGNLITALSWDSIKNPITRPLTTDNAIKTETQYSASGNVTLTKDGKDIETKFTYGSVGGFSDLYPTRIEKAFNYTSLKLTTDRAYDFSTGLETIVTDVDNNVSTVTSYDDFGRPTLVEAANGLAVETQTATTYSDAGRYVIVQSDLSATGDKKLVSIKHYDQLGRIRLSRTLEDASTESATNEQHGIKVQTRYRYDLSTASSYMLTSNLYRAATSGGASSEETMGWSRTKSDNGGRLREVETFSGTTLPAPWGSSTTSTGKLMTDYDANATTVTDQASKQRRSLVDGLGRLIRVDEPTSLGLGTIASPNQKTDYSYDVLDDLTSVTQTQQSPLVTQTRRFAYDSLKRLTFAANPEQATSGSLLYNGQQWAVKYEYDNNSNLLRKTDSRANQQGQLLQANYTYDELNRVRTRSYANDPQNTPFVTYTYDTVGVLYSKGRLTTVSSSVSSCDYLEYDALGRVKGSKQTTAGGDAGGYITSYGYNLASEMTSEIYPSGKEIRTSYDSAGRVGQVSRYIASVFDKTYASSFSYASHGAVKSSQLGNLKWEHTNFNSRLQPLQIGLGTSQTNSTILQLDYGYGATSANNGNVLTQTITIDATVMTQSYGYDALNRLSSASEGPAWSQTYDCDRYGNRAVRIGSYIPQPQLTPPSSSPTDFTAFNQSTNGMAVVGFGYDSAGNLTSDPTTNANGIVYDAENRQVSYTKAGVTTTYTYDGDGRRVKKADTGTTVFVYNVSGQLIAEYIFGTPSGGGTSYLTSDHLGSTRVVTKSDGTVKARYDYLPFGEELGAGVGQRTTSMGYSAADSTKQKFTQKERDSESGLDCFLARYYSSAQGRFTSPDVPFVGQDDDNPQTWNLYSYASNNPVNLYDPDGHRWFYKKNDKGGITDLQWVNPNSDGSFTSPGEGWSDLEPGRLLAINLDYGRLAFHVGENADGSPSIGRVLATGKAEDASMDLVALALSGNALYRILEGAVASYSALSSANAPAQNIGGITAREAERLRELLQRIPGVKNVRAFGSRTKGTQTAKSDLDIALIGGVNPHNPTTQIAVREAQKYAESIGIGFGKEGRTSLDIHVFRSLREMKESFRNSPNFDPSQGVPKPVKLK
jgi:RHS repeat-associated protein